MVGSEWYVVGAREYGMFGSAVFWARALDSDWGRGMAGLAEEQAQHPARAIAALSTLAAKSGIARAALAKCLLAHTPTDPRLPALLAPIHPPSDLQASVDVQHHQNNDEHDEDILARHFPLDFHIRRRLAAAAVLLSRARHHLSEDNRVKAAQAFQDALMVDVRCVEALDALTKSHMLTHEAEQTLLAQLPIDAQCPDPVEAEFLRVQYQCKLQKYGQPLAQLPISKMLDLSNNIDYLSSQADLFFYQGKFQQSYDLCRDILKRDAHFLDIVPSFFASMYELKKTNEIFYEAHQLVKHHPEEAASWFAVGCYYLIIENRTAARRFFRKSTAINGEFGPSWIGYGHSFAQNAEHDQAIAAYCIAARLFPGCHLPLQYVAMEYVQSANYPLAIQYFEQALSICTTDPCVFHEIGVVHYLTKDYTSARRNFETALKLCGAQMNTDGSYSGVSPAWEPTIIDLGHTCRKLDLYQLALLHYKTALALHPGVATTYSAIGFAYQLLGKSHEAIEYFHKALALNVDDNLSVELLNRALETFSDSDF